MQKTVTLQIHPVSAPTGMPRARIIQLSALMCQLGLATMALFVLLGGDSALATRVVAEPWDKPLHFAAFATIVVLLAGSHPRWGWHAPYKHLRHRGNHRMWLLLCTLAACALGAADELHQFYQPGRSAGLDVWLADALGAVVGAIAWARFVRWFNR